MKTYIEGSLIGSGTYGSVYKGIELETSMPVALKKIQLHEREGMPSTAMREISILRNISHENIIKLLHVIHQEDFLTIVFEFIDYDLMTYIHLHGNVFYLINQFVSGINYIHSRNIVHRDLKPPNILVNSKGILKIADFGLARKLGMTDVTYTSEVVTLWYRAPELLMGKTNYGLEIDIWSVGCIIYEMITKEPLLAGNSRENQLSLCIYLNLRKLENKLRKYYKIPPFIINTICRCLEQSPHKRISAGELFNNFSYN